MHSRDFEFTLKCKGTAKLIGSLKFTKDLFDLIISDNINYVSNIAA